jgi:hypothetical protein
MRGDRRHVPCSTRGRLAGRRLDRVLEPLSHAARLLPRRPARTPHRRDFATFAARTKGSTPSRVEHSRGPCARALGARCRMPDCAAYSTARRASEDLVDGGMSDQQAIALRRRVLMCSTRNSRLSRLVDDESAGSPDLVRRQLRPQPSWGIVPATVRSKATKAVWSPAPSPRRVCIAPGRGAL